MSWTISTEAAKILDLGIKQTLNLRKTFNLQENKEWKKEGAKIYFNDQTIKFLQSGNYNKFKCYYCEDFHTTGLNKITYKLGKRWHKKCLQTWIKVRQFQKKEAIQELSKEPSLTPNETAVLNFLKWYQETKKKSPSQKEIASQTNIKKPNISRILKALKHKSYINYKRSHILYDNKIKYTILNV